ncbi:SANT and BTB domain regulator of class switch recombination [Diorhabda sublineata]|uniref:SANT and BTB domain regulator of class switch recombination n=1 Tax=Diorhabda sublineata TaxID=1163346 RepID=UPI0024E18346|nr:SANT and BTB domain regulator of class switch recombination [Diorhabda sublineata]
MNIKMESEQVKPLSTNTVEKSKFKADTVPVSEISIKEFLNFLRTAYQVQDSIENILTANGMSDAIEWLKRKETLMLLNQNSVSCQTTIDINGDGDKKEICRKKSAASLCAGDCEPLKRKLSEVISEGLLDSVLPYLVHPTSSKKSVVSVKMNEKAEKPATSQSSTTSVPQSEKTLSRRRSSDPILKPITNKTESEVEINVCDELKSAKKTFYCNQNLLVSKMGYFATVTQGQRLEDMDISVHCDIGIFEWLMQWIKKDNLPKEEWPQLESNYVVPILVSAAFLEMDTLLEDCLLFCHEHMNEILKTNTNLSCLNDTVLTRLAAMYTNVEVEAIKDKKDKIQSRLFTKLIQSLAEPEPESVRGHWCSLARVFRCEKCQLLITPDVAAKIPCLPPCMRLQPDGTIISLHIRDPKWDINTYIVKLFKNLKSWRKVYWRLWGDAHFLFCSTCLRYFPSNQIGWCRYHPDTPQFFTLDAQRAPLPIGRFPCCGERAYRFQLLENFNGCNCRQHTVLAEDVKDTAVFAMLETYRHLIEEEPPQLLFPEKLTRLVARDPNVSDKKFVCKKVFWWDGFEIIPPRPKLGLLSNFTNRCDFSQDTEESSGEYSEEESTTSGSSDTEGSAESDPKPRLKPVKRKPKRKLETSVWQPNISARSNQDIQRAYEEKTIREITEFLNRNIIIDTLTKGRGVSKNSTPVGGIWVRLEQEWKETSQKNKTPALTLPGKNRFARGK